MASISDTETSEWGGFAISGHGLRCEAEWGVAAGSRSDGAALDPVAAAIDASDGMQTVAAATVSALELTGGTRGAQGDGALRVDLGRSDPDERRVVLVEEQGQYTWVVPERGVRAVEIAVEAAPGSRGLPRPVASIVRLVAVKTVGWAVRHASKTLVGAWDERRHPFRVRSWNAADHRDPDAGVPDLAAFEDKPTLLVIHGFTGSVHGSFTFPSEFVEDVVRSYGRRAFAFDHPTLAVSPAANATWLASKLRKGLVLDVLAHSRGGLVARELARLAPAHGVRVRSITFVATPNDGTPLGDPDRPKGLVDAVTNLVGAVPGTEVLEMALELLKDVVLESALGGLEGLVAMDPGGEYLTKLNDDALTGGPQLRAICADYDPPMQAGIALTARHHLLDAYFGGLRNDRIVPTLSTIVTSGAFSVSADHRLVLDSSRGVDHSTFWTNERVLHQLRDWLRADSDQRPPAPVPPAETEPAAEVALPPDSRTVFHITERVAGLLPAARKSVEELLGGPVNPKATPPTGGRPAVVVIPGIMGTHLGHKATGRLIWIDPLRLARGHLADLTLPPPAGATGVVEPVGLNRTYLPLITRLAEEWDVYLAPFDWRADILESARLLAEQLRGILETHPRRPVHLVAHSMGGLVARALPVVAKEVWDGLDGGEGGTRGRLLMLGTPNGGSFATPLILTGAEAVLKALALVDLRSAGDDVARVVASFPGIYQLLPHTVPADDDHDRLFEADAWGPRSPVTQSLLDGARRFHEQLAEVVDAERLVYVAGYGHPTPFRIEVDAPGKFKVGRITTGDGRVATVLGQLDDVRTYFSPSTHGGLPSAPDVLGAIGDLLANGTTDKLRDEAPVTRGDEIGAPVMVPAEEFDAPPSNGLRGGPSRGAEWRDAGERLDDALRLTLGGGTPVPSRPTVGVSVLNAGLEQARFPVVVGHYAHQPQGGSEMSLDAKLGGALRRRQRLGQYPERPGSAMYLAAPKGHRPRGAIVLGLGELGTLTPPNLAAAMTQGVVAYALAEREQQEAGAVASLSLGVSAVLVGTPGRRGLTIEQCVAALVEGVVQAVVHLNEPDPATPVEAIELQLVELYDQAAEEAALAVSRLDELLAPELLRHVEVRPDYAVHEGDGRLNGAPPRGVSGTSWVQVTARLAPAEDGDRSGLRRMAFSALARGAQANLIDHELDLAKIKAYVDQAVKEPDPDGTFTRTLYEQLFPHRAKFDLDRTESLQLVLDEEMAEIPWELLSAAALHGESAPLALRAGILRQLQSVLQTRERAERPTGRMVLVVGDPPTLLPRLPGARAEGIAVADLFEARGWDVHRLIYGADDEPGRTWMRILDALNARPYRVVHLAAHGIFDATDRQRSGVVIGPEPYHRITALDFKQMTVTPDLVFLNCCHLGRLGSFLERAGEGERQAFEQPHRVAASVAHQLLQNGVGAVVVAGWAVDDGAANAFATRLYGSMLDGDPFGEAVREARQDAHGADFGRTTTWGAYQCYGDPDFELGIDERPPARRCCLVSASQLARELRFQAARAGTAISVAERSDVERRVDRLRDDGVALLADGRVLEALAEALSELGKYEMATKAYEQALRDSKGHARLRAAEQLANMRVRLATRLARDAERKGEAVPERVTELFAAAATTLDRLDDLGGPSAERFALRGSLHKKRATTRSGDARREDLVAAREMYDRARSLHASGYHVNLWIQMTALAGEGAPLPPDLSGRLDSHYEAVVEREEREPSSDYWEIAGVADTLVTYAVVGGDPPCADRLEEAEERYRRAFELRSTVRQRDSALDHLEDLRRLVPDGQARDYEQVIANLKKVAEAVEE